MAMSGLSENSRGAVLMTVSMAAYTLNDTCMKALMQVMPLSQSLCLRGLLATFVLGVWVASSGQFRLSLSARDKWRVGLRAVSEVIAAFLFMNALVHMPIANASAVLQALPLTVTLAGAMFMGEHVGWRRLTAICVGFVGVLLIVRPGVDGFDVYSLYAVAAVVAITVRDLATRSVSISAPPGYVAIWASAGVALFGFFLGFGDVWVTPTGREIGLLAGAVSFILIAYIVSVSVMRTGDIAFVAPFRYTSLVWALVLGFLVFGDWPDGLTLIGAALVVATGVFSFYREQKIARSRHQDV